MPSAVEELLSKLLHPARLLLVKSNKAQADSLQRQVQQKYECEVDWVASVTEAKRRLCQHKYDLLLLGVTPQHEPAASFVQHVKSFNVPVVLVADQSYPPVVHEAVKYGVVCGLTGPLRLADIDELFSLFKIHVRSRENAHYFESRRFSLGAPLAV